MERIVQIDERGRNVYPWTEMKPGDFFIVRSLKSNKASGAAIWRQDRYGERYKSTVTARGVKITRVS